MRRANLLDHLAREICAIELPHPTRAAIDGMDAAGKTTLGNDLAERITAEGRPVVRVSVDNFRPAGHNARSWSGSYTPETYYREGFELAAFRSSVLEPAGPGGDRHCRLKMNDVHNELPHVPEWTDLADDAILIADGVYLGRPEFAAHWDYLVWLDVEVETSFHRSVERDSKRKPRALAIDHHRNRSMPALALYLRETNARERANIVIDNNDLERPEIVRDAL